MTDERQNLDSDPSTATAQPPAEPAPAAADGDTAAAAADQPQPDAAEAASPAEGDAAERSPQDRNGSAPAAEPQQAGGDEQEAAGGEDAGAAEAEPAGDEGGSEAVAAEGGEGVAAAETRAAGEQERGEAIAGGEAGGKPPSAAGDAPAEGEPIAAVGEIAGDEEVEAAEAVAAPTPSGEPAPPSVQAAETAAPVESEAGDAKATEGEAAAKPDEVPVSQPEASAASTAEGEAAATPAETSTPQPEASATSSAEGEAATQQPQTAASQPEAGAAPATEGEAAAPPAGETAATAAAAGTEAAAAEAAAPAEPEEPEDPALAALREAREKGTPVEGRVIGWNRGGFHVVVGEVTAFCPSSEMEVGRPKSPQSYVEKTFQFKVIKYQKKGRRVVLSRAAVLGEKRQQVLAELTPGSVAKGRVTSLPDFGAFVDLGGIEGLVHVSEISRGRVQHPKDALQIGQDVEVKVLKVEQGGERISLSMKDLEPDPWKGAGQRFGRGDRFSGKVLRKTEFGLFVELEPDVEGLLHVSQLPPGKSIDDAEYQPGQAVEGWVREVEPKRQRISLSLREVPSDDPWKEISQRFPEGESVEGTVESIAPFGVFVTLGPGVTGLLPNSQTGLPRGSNPARVFSPGQSVRVQVLSVDSRRKRISLGREGTRVEASKNDLQDFKRRERERERETPTAMAAAFARLRGQGEESDEP